jgi:hypothetical protein
MNAKVTIREFHLGDLLTITDGHLVSPSHIGGVYEIVDFVTGQQHMTHQLPRACGEVKPWLVQQHPWLADITVPDGLDTWEKVFEWLEGPSQKYGGLHQVESMPEGMYVGREPITELREMVGDKPIVILGGGPDEEREARG